MPTSPTGIWTSVENSRSGFTLIELSVALLLVVLLLSIAIPRLGEYADVELKSAVKMLATTMRYLHNEASLRKTFYRLVYDLDHQRYYIEQPIQDLNTGTIEFVRPRDLPIIPRRKLPPGVKFIEVEAHGGTPVREGTAFTLFTPYGTADPTTIHLQSARGREYTIHLGPYYGRVKILEGYHEFKYR